MVELANGVRVPADAEFVLEGWITKTLTDEGPFVDLTGTYDFIRQQPVIEIDRVTHRRDAHLPCAPAGPARAQAADGHAEGTDDLCRSATR